MEKDTDKKKDDYGWVFVLVGIMLVVMAVVLTILFFLNGSSRSVFGGVNVDTSDSLICSSDKVSYPFLEYDNSESKSMKVSATFNDGKLDTISLTYRLEYDNSEQAEKSSVENHIALNKHFYENSLGFDSFNAHFSVIEKSMQLNLYAKAKEINGISSKYFMLGDLGGSNKKESLVKSLNSHGLDCVVKQ